MSVTAEDLNVQPDNQPQPSQSAPANSPGTPAPTDQPQSISEQPVQAQPKVDANGVPVGMRPAQPGPPPNPAAHKASWIADTAEALAGGPQYKTSYNPETNKVTREKVPTSGKNIALALVIHALQGSLAGGSAKGPNAVGQAGEQGLAQGEKIKEQQRQQDQDEQKRADDDFNRNASTIQNNLRMRQLAVSMSDHDQEWNQKQVDSFKPLFLQLQEAGRIIPGTEQGLTEDEITKRMQTDGKAYAKQNGIPVGTDYVRDPTTGDIVKDDQGVPKVNLKYALVDPNGSTTMPEGAADRIGYWGKAAFPGYVASDGKTHSALQTTPIAIGAHLQAQTEVSQLETAQREFLQYADKMGIKDVDKDVLRDAIKDGSLHKSDVLAFEQFEGGHPLDHLTQALELLRKSNPQAAGRMAAAFDKIAPLESYDKKQQDIVEKQAADKAAQVEEQKRVSQLTKEPIFSEETAQGILSSKDPKVTADRKAEARSFLSGRVGQAKLKAKAEEEGRANISDEDAQTIAEGLLDPHNLTSIRVLPVKGEARSKVLAMTERLAKARGVPYDEGLIENRQKFLGEYEDPAKKAAINKNSLSNVLEHAGDVSELNDANRRSNVKILNTPINALKDQFGQGVFTQYQTATGVLKEELANYFAAGYAPNKDQQDMWSKIQSNEATPSQTEAFAKEVVRLAERRVNTANSHFKSNMGYNDPNLITPQAKAAAHKLLGNEDNELLHRIDSYGSGGILGRNNPSDQTEVDQNAKRAAQIPANKVKAWDNKGNLVGYADDNNGTNLVRLDK